jgi:hypothetical protein
MIDRRALLITGVLVLLAAAAYTLWIVRPRASMASRSLTAAPRTTRQSSDRVTTAVTRSLHVDGCHDDFIVRPGELIEPNIVPGSSIEQFRSVYGPEAVPKGKIKPGQPGIHTWSREAFSIAEGQSEEGDFVHVSLNPGHVVETLDGVELGLDSFGAIFRKMSDRKVEVHERLLNAEGKWTLIVSLYSSCGRHYRSEYTRTFDSTPEIEHFLNRRVPGPHGELGPLRSDVFMNKVVSEYTMVPSNGQNDSSLGVPSEHD